MEGGSLVLSDRVALEDVLARRRPDLLPLVADTELDALAEETRDQVRRALVDEICELPREGGDGRRALALLDLLRTV